MTKSAYFTLPRRQLAGLHAAALCSGFIAALLAPSGAHAQNNEQPPSWYQVEVVIFERLANNNTGDDEIWPKNVVLRYPDNWQKLLTPETAAAMRDSLLAEQNRGLTEDAAPSTDEALGSALEQPEASPLQQEYSAAQQTAVLEEHPLPPVLRIENDVELGFVQLPTSERTLNESKAAIERNRNMRVLFHEAWRQPTVSADSAPAVIVRGGNEYGEHTELEGSLRVSISRYLHIHSNLWLTQFTPNYGQESEHWPPLPTVPQHEPLQLAQNETPFSLQLDSEEDSLWHIDTGAISEYSSLIEQPFLIKQIVTMQQTRRMRSAELHYLDHPRLGLLIKVDSYTPELEEE